MMSRLEVEEKKVVQVATDDYCTPSMPLTVMEETTDYSWVQSGSTKLISEMMSCTDVGPLRDRLGEKLIQSLAEEFIDPAAGGLCPEGTGEESIFDYGSSMGKLPDSEGDYWIHDDAASTWTRMIVVPRKEYYHPGEGAERERSRGPVLDDLGT